MLRVSPKPRTPPPVFTPAQRATLGQAGQSHLGLGQTPLTEFTNSGFGRALMVGAIAAAGSKAFPDKFLGPFVLGTLLAFVVGISPRPR